MSPSSKLLIDDHPIQVLPRLAILIGLNEAIMLQQLHYWLNKSELVIDEMRWVYNSVEDWHAQFPWWSPSTIARTIKSLRDRQLIEVRHLSQDARDRTNYYTIMYAALESLTNASCHFDMMDHGNLTRCSDANCHDVKGTETPSETPTETLLVPAAPDTPPTANRAEDSPAPAEPQPTSTSPAKHQRTSSLPDPFYVTAEMRRWAAQKCPSVDLSTETEQFCDHHRGKGSRQVDWVATWRTWMRKAEQFAQERQARTTSRSPRATERELRRNAGTPREQMEIYKRDSTPDYLKGCEVLP